MEKEEEEGGGDREENEVERKGVDEYSIKDEKR